MSAGTSGESSLVRYTVVLSANTLSSRAPLTDEALEGRHERVVWVVHEDVARPNLREEVVGTDAFGEACSLFDGSPRCRAEPEPPERPGLRSDHVGGLPPLVAARQAEPGP
jgi:hypothetical protein